MSDDDYVSMLSEFRGEEGDLIPLLQAMQGRFGYISEQAVKRVSRFLRVSHGRRFDEQRT